MRIIRIERLCERLTKKKYIAWFRDCFILKQISKKWSGFCGVIREFLLLTSSTTQTLYSDFGLFSPLMIR
ncbi:hypothetical protein L1887_23635 [Cichorium endivia]|nr:hypothetical protein L1887_23635 [Cichorium endivia]